MQQLCGLSALGALYLYRHYATNTVFILLEFTVLPTIA